MSRWPGGRSAECGLNRNSGSSSTGSAGIGFDAGFVDGAILVVAVVSASAGAEAEGGFDGSGSCAAREDGCMRLPADAERESAISNWNIFCVQIQRGFGVHCSASAIASASASAAEHC